MKVWLTLSHNNPNSSYIDLWTGKPSKNRFDDSGVFFTHKWGPAGCNSGKLLVCRYHLLQLLKGTGVRPPRKGQIVEIELTAKKGKRT